MHWMIVIVLAIVLGWVCSLLMRRYGMGPIVCIPVAIIGAGLGGALDRLVFPATIPPGFSFYGLAFLLCVLALGGGVYAFTLTRSERRV